MSETNAPTSLSRRRFLKRTGWAAVGLTVVAAGSYPLVASAVPVLPSLADPDPGDGLAWVQMLPDGRARFFCPRMEMGQGASLGLSQAVAEELNLAQDQIDCVLPDTSEIPPVKMTVGSESILMFLEPVARGAATLREMLRQHAAEASGVAAADLVDAPGGFMGPDETVLDYADLVGATPVIVSVEAEKPATLYSMAPGRTPTAIGQSWSHPELLDIVTGKTTYSRDVIIPNMLHGAVVHPPVFGARIAEIDDSAARKLPFVVSVVADRRGNFAGVVTDNPFKLKEALEALQVEWETPGVPTQAQIEQQFDVDKHRAEEGFDHVVADTGDVDAAQARAAIRIQARYDTSFLAHSPMEPRASVVWVRPGRTEVWCGTQDAYFVRGRVAGITGQDQEQVIVHPHRMGGGFGGRLQCQPSEEAARLSQAVGRPVRVQWDRETELGHNSFQPIYSHSIDAGVAPGGRLTHWQHDFVSSPIIFGPMPELLGEGWLASGAVGLMDRFVPDMGSARGAVAPYQAADKRIRFASVRSPLPTSAWRGLGAAPNAFAIECAMDELAHAAGVDPLQFRLGNLAGADARLADVLSKAAEMAGWPRDPGPDRGLGIAAAVYKDKTPVAIVAEVHIDRDLEEIRPTHFWCAHDCGRVVNPDQVRNLIEGNVVWGCGLALKERITVEDGAISETNFHLYEPLRHSEAAKVEIALIEPPAAPPVGVGESALPPVAPALANAVFAATGQRLRRLPMSFDDLS